MYCTNYYLYIVILASFRYRPPDKPQNDIALVRIKGDPINFSSKIMPICLPRGSKFPDSKGVVYTAGYPAKNSQIFFKNTI